MDDGPFLVALSMVGGAIEPVSHHRDPVIQAVCVLCVLGFLLDLAILELAFS